MTSSRSAAPDGRRNKFIARLVDTEGTHYLCGIMINENFEQIKGREKTTQINPIELRGSKGPLPPETIVTDGLQLREMYQVQVFYQKPADPSTFTSDFMGFGDTLDEAIEIANKCRDKAEKMKGYISITRAIVADVTAIILKESPMWKEAKE